MEPYPADDFADSRAYFEVIITELKADDAARLDHAGLERHLDPRGCELMRLLYQNSLDLRSERERQSPPASVEGADGKTRTERRPSSRPLGSVFGVVTVHRLTLVKHGVSGGLWPMDAELNLPEGKYSLGVQREVALGVAQLSYEATVENVRRTTGSGIAKHQAEELAIEAARDFDEFYLQLPEVPEPTRDFLVLTCDGAGVVMRPEGLRPETKKRAQKAKAKRPRPALPHAPRTVEDRDRKRMAEVAAVYTVEPFVRTAGEVMQELRHEGPPRKRPKAKNKRVWASLERSTLAVVDEAFFEALGRDPENQRRWVVLVDGNPDQLGAVKRLAACEGVVITIVLDFIHVLEYLWKAGKALHEDAPELVEPWVTERAERILRGKAATVAAGMRRSATRRELDEPARKPVDACADYLLNHSKYLRYDEYLRDGLPIASGVIEGACRSLVRDRMDITGARWGLPGGEAVLKLRSLRASGDFDEYWQFHERASLERNHLARFADHELVELRAAA